MSMWGGRRQDEPAPKPVTATKPAPLAPSPTEPPKKEAPPLSGNIPLGKMDPEPPRGGAAVIGKGVKIVGQIFSKEDLLVDGEVEGTIELLEHRLTVGPNGKVQAGLKAREVVALGGTIQGNVEATERLEIRKEAKLIGDVKTARISIEDGAFFKGSIESVKPDPARAARPQSSPTASAVPVVSAAEVKR